jgi:cardiolipin synthase
MRSFGLNYEVSVMLTGGDIVDQFKTVEDSYRAMSRQLSLDDWSGRSFKDRYVDNTMRLTAALQ